MFEKSLLYLVAALIMSCSLPPQSTRQKEQAHFSMEQEDVPIEKPVDIPLDVLNILSKTEFVSRIAEIQSVNEVPSHWFVGSEVHLNGSDNIDLVVLPRLLDEVPAPNGGLFGANVGRFWVFRKGSAGYSLVLEISVHDLEVQKSKTKGYRDILTTSATAASVTTLLFKFDGQKYQLHKKETESERKAKPGSVHKTSTIFRRDKQTPAGQNREVSADW